MSDTQTVGPETRQVPAAKARAPEPKKVIQLSTWRGSQSEYKGAKLRQWFALLMAEEIISSCQSESDGNICFTVVYR